ncbi:MAG: DrmB family protein [Candidatus Freyarchaeum deiterrae]
MRPSKLIMTFGPGSIVDFPDRESYIVMGPDYWKSHETIQEPRLAKKLDCDHFGSPQKRWDDKSHFFVGIAVRDFPHMRVCPSCGKLSYEFRCKDCKGSEDEKGPKTMPPRLVAACKGGHIQDFPWKAWCGCTCNRNDARLFLIGESIEAEGSDLKVVCKNCRSERNLMLALGQLKYSCNGERPWLGDEETCSEKLYGLMRGASNVYFPVIESSLSIPPYSTEIHKDVEKHMDAARANWVNNNIKGYIENNDELKKYIEDGKYTENQLIRAFGEKFGGPSSIDIKGEEWDRLVHDVKYGPNDDFQTKSIDITGSNLDKWFARIVLVTKLREVVAVTGFNRVEPNNPDTKQKLRMEMENWSDFLNNHPDISPSLDIEISRNWLPGVELFGEGIFFKFKESMVNRWNGDSANIKRCKRIISQPKQPFKKEGVDLTDERTILVHTFAHQFIRQISLECGYSMASLKERLYVRRSDERDMCGVLIYTASSDSEGTLGGLVAQAKDSRTLLGHISSIIDSVRFCSQDPLCGTHEPTTTKNPWGASCHSCSQLPETSCEGLQNKLLDRFTLISNDEVTGYFDDSL